MIGLWKIASYGILNRWQPKQKERAKIMLKFENTTTKESFEKSVKWSGNKIEEMKKPHGNQRLWKISDCCGNVWDVLFTGNVDEYRISYRDVFSVDILMYGNMVEIHRAIKNGRNLKADRNLKQFMQLALLVSCYRKFGYLK